jgi:hypothetical protein
MTKGARTPRQTKGDNNVVQQVILTAAVPAADAAAGTTPKAAHESIGILQQVAKSAGTNVEMFIAKLPEQMTGLVGRWLREKAKLVGLAFLSGGLGLGIYGVSGKEATVTWVAVERGPVGDSGKVCTPRYSNQEIDALLKDPNKYGRRLQTWVVKRDGHRFSGVATFQGEEAKHEVNGSVPRAPTDSSTQSTGGLLAWMRSAEGEATYNLKPSKADPNIFVGRQIAKDCDVGAVVSCVFVLAPEGKISAAESMMAALAKEPEGLCLREPLL